MLLKGAVKWLAMPHKTDETGTDLLIKTFQFFVIFLRFTDLKTIFNDTLDGWFSISYSTSCQWHAWSRMPVYCTDSMDQHLY